MDKHAQGLPPEAVNQKIPRKLVPSEKLNSPPSPKGRKEAEREDE